MRTTARKSIPVMAASVFLLVFAMLCPASAAGRESAADDYAASLVSVRKAATGSQSYGNELVTIDISNISQGYVMCKYTGDIPKIKVQIAKSGGVKYNYDLNSGGRYEVFPITCGNGSYTVGVYEHVFEDQYATAFKITADVSLSDSSLPFLYPSQIVNFNESSAAVKMGGSLAKSAGSDLSVVANVYNYVVGNISYDYYKASTVQSGYVPDIDAVLESGLGICYDYAVLTAAMLRSEDIPTQVRVGYVSTGAYHAWISVYITDIGWVNNMIYFDGKNWELMDPTFAANSGQDEKIMDYIGNGSNYSTLYTY